MKNIDFFVTDNTNTVIMAGGVNASDLDKMPMETGHTAYAGSAEIGQVFNPVTKVLSAATNVYLMDRVRATRNQLLRYSAADLVELRMPDSFPSLTPAQKQAKIDALIVYRQALRDITTQPDPANIVWPTPPV